MAKKLKLSTKASEQMYRVRNRLKLDGRDFLWTLRIAFARSLQSNSKLGKDFKIQTSKDVRKAKRFEIEVPTLEQRDGLLFRALLQQFYQKKLTDAEYEDYLLKHVEHGLDVLENDTQKFSGYEYLVAIAKKGIQDLKIDKPPETIEKTPIEKGFEDILAIRVGINKETSEPHLINFNKTDEHDNNYMGIVGRPGSGKTYFVKHFLTELRKASKFQTHFIIFDYAKGDVASDRKFIRDTKAELLSVLRQPIPLNIFQVSASSHQARRFAAERIVGIVRNVEANIGKVQEQNLYDAILGAYERVIHDDFPYPDFHSVRDELEGISPKPDSLTSVFRPLTQHNLFASRDMSVWNSLLNRTVIFDIHELPTLKDLCVFFVLNEIYRQLILLPDSKVDENSKAREMRTVIVIDEAHHFLKSKKRVKILEDLIREIRSKGASVILLSQSPDDYDQADFNFLELLEFVYVLGCNPSSHRFLQQVFGVSAEQAKKLMREVAALNQGEALGKGKDRKVVQLMLCK
ncbi:MAG: ATP-binding protein [Candidatus Heimdallarchaeota archaeon]